MMGFRVIFVSVVLIAWMIAGSYIYTCKIMLLCEECCEDTLAKQNPLSKKISPKKDSLPTIQKEKEILSQKYIVYFEEGGTEIIYNVENEKFFELAKTHLDQNPEKSMMVLIGHTDDVGTAEINLEFGLKRAESVKQYLLAKGFNPKFIELKTMGMTQPLMENTSEAGRARNRRVEILLEIKN